MRVNVLVNFRYVCMGPYKRERREEGGERSHSLKGAVSPGDRALCLCLCVSMCVCQPVLAQYPGIQPAPGTMVHPTRRTVALFISETHSLCVFVRRQEQCVDIACVYSRV